MVSSPLVQTWRRFFFTNVKKLYPNIVNYFNPKLTQLNPNLLQLNPKLTLFASRADTPRELWPQEPEVRDQIELDWDKALDSDRRQELVFIGTGFKDNSLSDLLQNCLLSEQEASLGIEEWVNFEDPFPSVEFFEQEE